MEDLNPERWAVTYTKHIKQKRKVYQDGFLDLHSSTNKLKLYDDSENLLECRILKKDEVVSSGETLTFNAYLIDVGDPQGDRKPIPDLKFQGRNKKVTEKFGSSHRQKFMNSPISVEDGKTNADGNKARPNNLSPSQKIIREFKRTELRRYGAPQTSPAATKPSVQEWQVLYTTQVTQKAKKYHDGFLQLAAHGSLGRQVMLFDPSRKLLDSKFLKKDEVIRSGESMALDAHLVDIGEPEGNYEPLVDLNVQGNSCKVVGKTEIMCRQQNCLNTNNFVKNEFKKSEMHKHGAPQSSPDTTKSSITEWQVLYTTQVTQKGKKYHDGFLRLAIGESLGRKVLLYDASRKLLDNRFLKKDEVIRSGESIVFDTHLVDVGEPEGNGEPSTNLNVLGNNYNVDGKTGILPRQQNYCKANKSVVKEEPQNNTYPRKDSYSNIVISSVDNIKLRKRVPTNKPPGKPQNYTCFEKDVDSNFSISSVDEIKLRKGVATNKPLRDAHQILSFLQKPMVQDSIVTDTERSITRPSSSSQGHQVSIVSILDFPEDSPPPRASEPNHEPSENVDIKKSPDLMYYKEISNCNGSQLSMDAEIRNSHQPCVENQIDDTKWHNGDLAFGIPTSSAHDPDDKERKSSEEVKSAMEINDFPNFDLGF